jgi:glucose-6-phosphate 1-dehydrogenase
MFPFYVRFGKRLAKGGTEIAVQFKNTRMCSSAATKRSDPNVLVIRIQPDEGISLRIQAKRPGAR